MVIQEGYATKISNYEMYFVETSYAAVILIVPGALWYEKKCGMNLR